VQGVGALQRIELLLNDDHYQQYISNNTDQESGIKYCQHGLPHHMDVARIAYILVLEHNDLGYFTREAGLSTKLVAKEVIFAAGLLHDIAKWKEVQEGVDHAASGARLARDILPRVCFDENETEIICRAIYEHRNISQNMSFLGERIHRADNLSRFCGQCEERNECPKRGTKELSVVSLEY
jgi:HD superfamily phosphodiesterase